MTEKRIAICPLSVAWRGGEGSIATFECVMPAEWAGNISVWATCGQRKRFPVAAAIALDTTDAACRKVISLVAVPPQYTACTLHVCLREGLRVRHASCRIPHEQFWELTASAKCAEMDERYHQWFLNGRADAEELRRQRESVFPLRPLISIVVPVFRTPEEYLSELLDSILSQTYENWELVIVNVSGPCEEVDRVLGAYDDGRIRVIAAPNGTIPENTNVGIAAARGDYVAFIDHDDFVEPEILFHYVEAINEQPSADLFFCDEDLWDAEIGRFCGARFKPGWNPDLLFTHNYACHMLMVSRRVLELTERSGVDVNGAQDYDLTLKAAEVARGICHVPGVYYHWRRHPQSTALNRGSKPYALEAGRVAVQGHFDRIGVPADVESDSDWFTYRPHYRIKERAVSVVLLAEDASAGNDDCELLQACGRPYEVLVAAQGDVNAAVARARYPHIVVVDDSVEPIGCSVVDSLVEQLAREEVGCCSALIADAVGMVRSAGLVYRSDSSWRNAFEGFPRLDFGYMFMLEYARDVLAVPLRCLAFRKDDFERVGGFDEQLQGDWQAIDFCLRLHERGLFTILAPYECVVVAEGEIELANSELADDMLRRHPWLADGDPYFSEYVDECARLIV